MLPAEVLRQESLDVGLIPVGNRGLRGFPGTLVGSGSLDACGGRTNRISLERWRRRRSLRLVQWRPGEAHE